MPSENLNSKNTDIVSSSHFNSKKGPVLFIIIMALILVPIFISSFFILKRCAYEKSVAIPATATVTEIRASSDETGTEYRIYVSFSYDGYTCENAYWGISDNFDRGDTLTVMIVPEHPPYLYNEGDEQIFFAVFTILISLLLLLIFGIWLFPPVSPNADQAMMLISLPLFAAGAIFTGGALLLQNLSLSGFLVTGLICLTGGLTLFIIQLFRKKMTKKILVGLLLELLICGLFVGTLYLSQSSYDSAGSDYSLPDYSNSSQQIGQHFS